MPKALLYARIVDDLAGLVAHIPNLWPVASRHPWTGFDDGVFFIHAVYPIALVSVCDTERTKGFTIEFFHDSHVPSLQVHESSIPHMRVMPKHPRVLERTQKFTYKGP